MKIHLQTYGCSLNKSDSEAMAGILAEEGHELVGEQEADIHIINSCTVKSNPEQRLFHQIRTRKKPMIIAGCVPKADPKNEHFSAVSVISPKALSRINEAVDATMAGKVVHFLDDEDEARNLLPTIRSEEHIAIIPINAGCLSNCSYCKTKHARGGLQSYPPEEIEKQFREAVNDGAKEVWLTSQDTGCYGLDIKTDIISLLERLLSKEGDYRIRLGMANPQYLLPRLEGMTRIMQHEKMFRFLHLPVQAGSDKVLRDMRRGYTVKTFKTVIEALRSAIPDLTIATDIIVGYPTETEEDYHATEELIKNLTIPVVNISKFYPRPDTPAAGLQLLPTDKVKKRSSALKKVCEAVAKRHNGKYVGKTLPVLIDEDGKKPGTMIARADNYAQIIVPTTAGKKGERATVTITSNGTFDARAL